MQRIVVPARYVVANEHPDLLDVRVVDAQGVVMPMAWIAVDEKQQVTRSTNFFKAYPIMGNASLESRSDLRMVERDGERILEWSDSNASSPRQQLGVLFDTRSLTADLLTDAIVLDADVVAGQPVSLSLASSTDLSDWEVLTNGATIAQFKNADETLTHNSIKLPPTAFNQRYLRITWPSTNSIKIRGATLASYHQSEAARQLQKITLALSTSNANNQDAKRNMLWHFDKPLDVVGIEIKTANKQTFMPIHISGKNGTNSARRNKHGDSDAQWQHLGSGVISNLLEQGRARQNDTVFFAYQDMTDLKITMDNPIGWPADTQVSLLIEPRAIAFVASGAAPYFLTLGEHDVNLAQTLPIQSLINGYQAGAEYRLPLASLIDVNEQEIVSMDASEAHRPYLLWGVLTAGVLLLLFMVFVVVRQMGDKNQP